MKLSRKLQDMREGNSSFEKNKKQIKLVIMFN